MNHKGFFDEMFARVDVLDASGFAACFTEGGVFRFGNNEPVAGRGRIEDFIRGFFGSIGGISHQFENCWALGERAFGNGFVTYVRKDGSKLTVPWATISRFEEGKLAEYNAYVDASELFNPRSVSPQAEEGRPVEGEEESGGAAEGAHRATFRCALADAARPCGSPLNPPPHTWEPGGMFPETTGIAPMHGVDIAYGVRGAPEHPALLLLMGNGCGSSFWTDPFCELLAQGSRRVLRFDYRDTGLSTHVEDFERQPYSLDELARDALGLLDHLGIQRAHLVGLSMGGFLAQRLALRHPERVHSLTSMMSTSDYAVLLHAFMGGEAPTSHLPPPDAEWMKALGRLSPEAPLLDLMVENWRLANGARAPFDEAWWRELQGTAFARGDSPRAGDHHRRAAERIQDKNLLPALRRLTVPALFIQGSEDPIFSPLHARAAAAIAPKGSSLVIDGMGHALNPHFFPVLARTVLEHTSEKPT